MCQREKERQTKRARERGSYERNLSVHIQYLNNSVFLQQKTTLDICEPGYASVSVSVPDLIADFLLILFPVTSTATAEKDDSNQDEDQEYGDYGCCDDTCRVGGWKGKNRVERSGKFSVGSNHVTLGLHSIMNSNYCAAFNYSFGCPLLMTEERSLLSASLNS